MGHAGQLSHSRRGPGQQALGSTCAQPLVTQPLNQLDNVLRGACAAGFYSYTGMQKTWFRSLGQKDPLEEEMATHSLLLARKIPWTQKPGRLQSMQSHTDTHRHTQTHTHPGVRCQNVFSHPGKHLLDPFRADGSC